MNFDFWKQSVCTKLGWWDAAIYCTNIDGSWKAECINKFFYMKWLLSAMEVGQQLLCTYRLLCLCAAKLFVFFLLWCICYFSGWISAWQECTYSEASQGWICAGRYWKAMERHKCKLSFGCPYCKSLDYKRFPPLLLFMPFTECWDNGLEADFARRYCSHLLGHVLLMLFVFFLYCKPGWNLHALLRHFPEFNGRIYNSELPSLDTLCPASCRGSCTLNILYNLLSSGAGKDPHAGSLLVGFVF